MVEAVKMQTTKVLEKKNITMPDVKLTGTYEILVKLHPQARAKRGSEALSVCVSVLTITCASSQVTAKFLLIVAKA